MKWFWKVRMYVMTGHYFIGEVVTSRDLAEIDTIKDFYEQLIGAKMILEGMSETSYNLENTCDNFYKLTRQMR